jgi:hypothetical protein
LHSLHRPHEALDCVKRAGQISDVLGLDLPGFSSSYVAGSVEEESTRRTFWELHTVQIYLAALHREPSLLTKTGGSYPSLPSAAEAYELGACDLRPASLTSFENRAFALNSRNRFSASCYRIEAIHLVQRVLRLPNSGHAHADEVHAVDNAIAAWRYYLPPEGEEGEQTIDNNQNDPILLQAHFFVHTASIMLHFPRSSLPSTVPTAAEITCVKEHTQGVSVLLLQHSAKAIAASKKISELAANLASLESVSPLFVCAVILACIVQLAASTLHSSSRGSVYSHPYRDRIILLLGVLSELGRKWTVARNALQPLKLVAETIFAAASTAPETAISSAQLTSDSAVYSDEIAGVSWFDLFAVDDCVVDFTGTSN